MTVIKLCPSLFIRLSELINLLHCTYIHTQLYKKKKWTKIKCFLKYRDWRKPLIDITAYLFPRWCWQAGNLRRDTWWRSSRQPRRRSCPSVSHEAARKYWAEPRDAPLRRGSPPSTCTHHRPPPARRLCSREISRRRELSRTGLSWICKQIATILRTFLRCYLAIFHPWENLFAKNGSILSNRFNFTCFKNI